VRVAENCKDVKFFYFELSNNGDTLFTEMQDKFAPGYVFSETAESRLRNGKLEYLVRYGKNGKKWVTDKIEIEVSAKEAEIHFYYVFGTDEDGKTKILERTVYRIIRSDGKGKIAFKKSDDGKDSSIHFTNLADTTVYAIGHDSYAYGEIFRRNESNLFSIEWRGVNSDNPCRNQKALKPIIRDTTVRIFFPNLKCDELSVKTAGKYQVRIYTSLEAIPFCTKQNSGAEVCILDAREYILEFEKQ
jgi:hypothetical protein